MSETLGDDNVIDVGPLRRRRWRRWLLAAVIIFFILLSRSLSIYLSALWFGSLGYQQVYWYIFKWKVGLFFLFSVLTIVFLRGAFWLLERAFSTYVLEKRTIVINNQPVQFSPARFVKPISWI